MEKVGSHACITDSLASKEEEEEIESIGVLLGCRSDSCSGWVCSISGIPGQERGY